MSTSDGATFQLRLTSNSDTELYIFDAALHRQGYGVHALEKELPRGLYKLRAVRGSATAEQLIALDQNEHVHLDPRATSAIAPIAPVYGQWTREIEALAARALQQPNVSAFIAGVPPTGASNILLMSHRDRECLPDPLEELKLYRWRQMDLHEVLKGSLVAARLGDEWWSAWSTPAEPGCYQIELGRGRLRQAFHVINGYDTRIFIRRMLPSGAAEDEAMGQDNILTDLSVQMALNDPRAPVVYDDHYETIEVARHALETERPIIVDPWVVDDLLHSKWENPMMGIGGTHLFLAALERTREQREGMGSRNVALPEHFVENAHDMLKTILENLERILEINGGLGNGMSADLLALRIRAQPFLQELLVTRQIEHPPIFWASWEAILAAAIPGGPVTVPRWLWSQIALCYPIGPYFAWRRGRTSIDRAVDTLLEQRTPGSPPEQVTSFALKTALAGPAAPALSPNLALRVATALGAPLSLLNASLPHEELEAEVAPARPIAEPEPEF